MSRDRKRRRGLNQLAWASNSHGNNTYHQCPNPFVRIWVMRSSRQWFQSTSTSFLMKAGIAGTTSIFHVHSSYEEKKLIHLNLYIFHVHSVIVSWSCNWKETYFYWLYYFKNAMCLFLHICGSCTYHNTCSSSVEEKKETQQGSIWIAQPLDVCYSSRVTYHSGVVQI